MKTLLSLLFLGVVFTSNNPTSAYSKTLLWSNGEYSFDQYDCKSNGFSEIEVTGIVVISRPDDTDFRSKPNVIKITCPRINFLNGAEIHTPNELVVAVDTLAGSLIVFKSTRGKSGENADATPQLWRHQTAPDGVRGLDGKPDGKKTSSEICKDGRDGGDGARGTNGHNGQHGQKGANGKVGYAGSRITLGVGSFETGNEILEIYSLGGKGGSGGKGGRGLDGGRGGDGGHAGRGGNAECFHRGANGGNGGDGGDGGRGGNGGPGGNGGNGGAGGDVTFGLVQNGKRPAEYRFFTNGGKGGNPGLGGDFGFGGDFGIGGNKGRAGKGWFSDGRSGNDGVDGDKGKNGQPGPLGEAGLDGPDGSQGGTGTWQDGPITPAILEQLKKLDV